MKGLVFRPLYRLDSLDCIMLEESLLLLCHGYRSLKFDHKTFPYLHSDVGFRCVLVIGNYVDELLYRVRNDMLEHTSRQVELLRVQKKKHASEGREKK